MWAGYKWFLFWQAQKGFHLNISQVILGMELFINLCKELAWSHVVRFFYCAIDYFGVRGIMAYLPQRILFSLHVPLSFITTVLLSFYWSELVGNTTGKRATFLESRWTQISASVVCVVLLGMELATSVTNGLYIGGDIIFATVYSMAGCNTLVGFAFLFSGRRLVKALSSSTARQSGTLAKVMSRQLIG
jgi:hypothetical protein